MSIFKKHIKSSAILATLILVAIINGLSIYLFQDYGWTVFLLSPFILGFIPAFILGFYENATFKTSFNLGMKALLVSWFLLLILALEGMMCIFMASPLLIFLTFLGSAIAYAIHDIWGNRNPVAGMVLILIAASISFGFDVSNNSSHMFSIKTKTEINAPINEVWKNVVSFSRIPEPKGWFFKTGIAYPLDAQIKGRGVGAIRYCNFTTGSFVEPITIWNEPNLLAFDVKEFPVPMIEYNPFWDVHPPHLNGYFQSHKGQFKLTEINKNKTLLEGTTWYSVDIYPQVYWKLWSEYIVHKIHGRVLEHIKKEAEG